MHLGFLRQPVTERQLFFEQAASSRRMHPAVMEKDFWVCWLLAVTFENPALANHLVFKGGTSLSKVFRVIERFSEDLDLSLAPAYLGIAEAEVEQAASGSQRQRWI